MVKNTILSKILGAATAVKFGIALFGASAVVNCLVLYPLYASEVPETVPPSLVPQEANAGEALPAPTVGDIAEAIERVSDRKDSETERVQGIVSTPTSPTLRVDAGETSNKLDTDGVMPRHNILSNQEEQGSNDTMSQVTSVSQLQDIDPGDWAFEALLSLVERYGCIASYPDGTYQGNRAMTRYEFAAGLNACLDKINELTRPNTPNLATKEDLVILQRLQEEFAAELATLRGRVDALEARLAEVEANQFSTTTKLFGVVDVVGSDIFGDKKAAPFGQRPTEDLDVSSSLSARTFLFLNTSFTGKDLLQILLAAGNVNRLDRFVTGTDMTAYNSTVTVNTQNNLILGSIFYQFPVGDKLTAFISPGTSVSVDFFNSIIPTRSISAFGERNPIFKMFEFTGGGSLLYKPSEALSLQVGYGNYTFRISNPADGLFGDDGSTYGAVLTVKPSQSSNLVFSYIHYYSSQLGPVLNATGGTGSLLAQAPFGESTATEVNAFGLEASYRLSKRFSIGGWVGYEKARADASVNAEGLDVSKGDRADIWNWAVTMAFPDFGKKGSQLNFIFGTPPWVAKNDVNGRADRNRSYHIEASYNYPLSQNIVITPGLAVILNPEHNSNNDPLWLGTLKTTLFL